MHLSFDLMSPTDMVEFLLARYPDLNVELSLRRTSYATSTIALESDPRKFKEWTDAYSESMQAPIGKELSDQYKIDLLRELYIKFIEPFLAKYTNGSRKLVDRHFILTQLAQKWA